MPLFLRPLLVAILFLMPSLAAAQLSKINFFQVGSYYPNQNHRTTSHLHIQGKNADGTIAYELDCDPISPCGPQAGAATYSVTLEGFNPDREEITSETCNGVPSVVFQQACQNGPLVLSMRVRLGKLRAIHSFSTPGANVSISSADLRLEFAEDATKYWEPRGVGGRVPAGKYHVTATNTVGTCAVVQANPGVYVDVPAGDTETTVDVIFTPTTCKLTYRVTATATAGGYVSTGGTDDTCVTGAKPSEVECVRTVAFGDSLTITAHPEAGATMGWTMAQGNVCAGVDDGDAICTFTVRGAGKALTNFYSLGDGGASSSSSSGGASSGGTDDDAGTSSGGSSGGVSSSSSSSGASSSSSSSGNGPGPSSPSVPDGGAQGDDAMIPDADEGGCSSAPAGGSSVGVLGTLAWLVMRRRSRRA